MNKVYNSPTSLCVLFSCLCHPRPERDGAATGVDAICTYHPDPTHPGLDREKLYQELSQLTDGVTYLGTYTLDSESLYVNGECPRCSLQFPV